VRRENAPADRARILHSLGTVLNYLGEHQIGHDYLEQALTIRRQLGDLRGEAISLNNLVSVYYSLGDFLKAKVCCEEALEIHRTVGNPRVEADTLTNLAGIHHLLGNLATAREDHLQALALYWELKDRSGESLASNNLALVLYDLGEYRLAQEYGQRAVAVARNIGDKEGEGFALTTLGLALEGVTQWAAAAQAYDDALTIRRQIGQEGYAVDDIAGLARIAWKQGDLPKAAAYIHEALDWIAQSGIQGIEYPLRVYLTAYEILTAYGQEDDAQGVLIVAHTLLLDQAAEFGDKVTKQVFLEQMPVHKQLCRYYAELIGKT
jgi:tetratricopeptide (TPR) repeat protein